MDKQQLLQEIKNLAISRQISKQEVLEVFESAQEPRDIAVNKKIGVSELLYYIGGGIVFLGICILVGQNWESLNSFSRVLITLGSAVAAYFTAVALIQNEKTDPVGQSFFFISALLLPLGIIVAFDQAGVNAYTYGFQSLAAAISLLVFALSYYIFRKNLFHIFNVIFSTWLFFALTWFISGSNPFYDETNFFFYRGLVAGLSYMLLGYYFATNDKEALSGPLYGFGVLAFLGSALVLQKYSPNANAFWEIIYPGLVFGIILLSTKIKSKSFLVMGAIFLMIYILKITAEYFSEGLGWPASLVIAGLALMGVGYYTVQIKKKYLDRSIV